jgi:hypothetical protein
MKAPERDDSCVIEWNPADLSLDDLMLLTSVLSDLYSGVAVPYETNDPSLLSPPETVESPQVAYIRMGSPLVTELFTTSGGKVEILALGMVGYLLKHPEVLSQWLPRFRAGSYRARGDEQLEKRRYEDILRTLAARGQFEVQGAAVDKFISAEKERVAEQVRKAEKEPKAEDRIGREDHEADER